MMFNMEGEKNGLWMVQNLRENLYKERRMAMGSLNGERMSITKVNLRII